MTFGHYDIGGRYNRRKQERNARLMVSLAVYAVIALSGFWLGKHVAESDTRALTTSLDSIQVQYESLENELMAVRADLNTAQVRYQDLKSYYANLLPQEGPLPAILEQAKTQLEQGVEGKRLLYVLKTASPPEDCTDPETRRIVVRTPIYNGGDSTTTIADGLVQITASGQSAQNKNRQPEAWYDPAQPVEVQFSLPDNGSKKAQGVMPLRDTLIFGNREYRFHFSKGAKSFMKITYDSCSYP